MTLTDTIDWSNMPEGPSPQYSALIQQVMKGNRAIQEEAVARQLSDLAIYTALDELRFGVEQMTGDTVPTLLPTVTRA